MELSELSPALPQPQDTVVDILDELRATLPSQEEELRLFMPKGSLHSQLEGFSTELRAAKQCIEGIWRFHRSSSNPVRLVSLSGALAAWQSTPWTTWDDVTMAAREWQGSVDELVDSWVRLARAATQLHNACREAVTEAVDMEARATARARHWQKKTARDGTAEKNRVELGLALGREKRAKVVSRHKAWLRREARVAASRATSATMVRRWVKAALELLERLVAACAEATVFLREWQRRVGDIRATLEDTNEESPNVPEDMVAKVAVAEQLWEANARLAKDHLLGAVRDIIKFCFGYGHNSPCWAAKRYEEAIKAIPWLLQPPEHPQGILKVSPVSMELQEVFRALLQPQVTVVATLGELLATLPRRDEMELVMPTGCLYRDLEEFTKDLWDIIYSTDGTWWRRNVPYHYDDPPTSLSQVLAAYKSTPWTTWDRVIMAAKEWQGSLFVLLTSWDKLASAATELHSTCREVATEAADMVATTTARARELQDEAARDGTAQENMVELGQTLGREEGAEVVAGHEAQVRREARVAASWATRATMVRQRLEVALGLLERLVAACDEATVFPGELRRLLGGIEAAFCRTNEASRDVPEALVAKVAVAEWLWEANARLAKDHLVGTLGDIKDMFSCDSSSSSARGVTKKCQKAIEDIPNLLQGW